jgi:hypothetical protein
MSGNAWRWIAASVCGTSHSISGTGCQDSSLCQQVECAEGSVFVAFASDGAGSASQSAEGAKLLCEVLRDETAQFFVEDGAIEQINPRLIANWIEHFRNEVMLKAESAGLTDREYACTALGAIIGPSSAIFFQVGDGAIVFSLGSEYRLAFWPERGEYENTTYFVTQSDFLERLQFISLGERVTEIALLSDGLQRLALDYGTKAPHQAFFNGFFPSIRNLAVEKLASMNEQLAQYLNSPKINQRTDDDKTLVLAVQT